MVAGALPGESGQTFIRRLPRRKLTGKVIAKLFEVELATLGNRARSIDPALVVAEKAPHLCLSTQEALGIRRELSPRFVEGLPEANAVQDVCQRLATGNVIVRARRGDERHGQRLPERLSPTLTRTIEAIQMPIDGNGQT